MSRSERQDGRIERTEFVIEGGRGRASLDSIRELWSFREVLGAFAARQVRIKYKQAAVGAGWAVLQPAASAAIFAVFVGKIAKVGSEGVPYVVFALAGMVAWSYFSTAVASGMDSLVADAGLLRKIYFPREVLPLSGVIAALIDLGPALVTLFVALTVVGIRPALAWVALPLPILVLILSASALGLALSGLNVYYRDVRYALPFALQLGLFASPVIFSLQSVPHRWRTAYAILNPVAIAIDDLRRITLHSTWPSVQMTLAALGWSVCLLVVAYSLFKKLERGFADRV